MCDEGSGATLALNVSPSAAAWYESLLRGEVHPGPTELPAELVDAGLVDPLTGTPHDPGPALIAARRQALAAVHRAQLTVTDAFTRSVPVVSGEPPLVRRVHPRHAVRSALARSRHAREPVRLMDGPRGAATTAARLRMVARMPAGRVRVLHRGHHQLADTRLPSTLAAHTRFDTPSPIRFLLVDDPEPRAWLWHDPPAGSPTDAGRRAAGWTDQPDMLCTTSTPVLAMLRTLFDVRWDAAVGALPVRGRVTDEDVLAALVTSPSDDAAARALGISVRTFARRVHDLMRSTGCTTRFQLALTVAGAQ